jgi:hypothetical protein
LHICVLLLLRGSLDLSPERAPDEGAPSDSGRIRNANEEQANLRSFNVRIFQRLPRAGIIQRCAQLPLEREAPIMLHADAALRGKEKKNRLAINGNAVKNGRTLGMTVRVVHFEDYLDKHSCKTVPS